MEKTHITLDEFMTTSMKNLLFLAASPADQARLNLGKEHDAVKAELKSAEFALEAFFDLRAHRIQDKLLEYKPFIVHFSGHGTQRGEIYIEDQHGDGHPISSRALGDLFGLLKGNIQLVFLNACYSEEQAQAISEHIDCVIGMSNEIEDEAARTFSVAFYRALGFGTDLRTAFDLGCNAIDIENLEDILVPKILAPRVNPGEIRFFRG